MKSILEAFATAHLMSGPRCWGDDAEYEKLADRLFNMGDALDEPQKQKLEELQNLQDDFSYQCSIDHFLHGYRVGVLMTMEVLSGADQLVDALYS